jgi:hypothetical protein
MTKTVDRLIRDLETRVRVLVCPITYTVVTEPAADDQSEPKRSTVTESGLDSILRRARLLLEVEHRAGYARADGYPSKTAGNGDPGGGKGGGRLMVIPPDDACPDIDRVPTTPTEVAALAEARTDPVSVIAVSVTSHLRRVAHELDQLDAALGAWERMRMVSKVPDPPQCYIVGELLGLPWDDYWEPWRSTSFERLLDDPQFAEPRKVCQWAYWFVRDNRRLPTKDEALRRLRQVAADRLAGKAG